MPGSSCTVRTQRRLSTLEASARCDVPARTGETLRASGFEVSAVVERGLAGSTEADILAAAVVDGYVLLTENVSDFARIDAEYLTSSGHHLSVLFALSSRFSRRPGGIPKIAATSSQTKNSRNALCTWNNHLNDPSMLTTPTL
jgi:Domain of unknown function (DUF5615)